MQHRHHQGKHLRLVQNVVVYSLFWTIHLPKFLQLLSSAEYSTHLSNSDDSFYSINYSDHSETGCDLLIKIQWINEKMRQLTVSGLGSRMRLINFFAPEENHGGQETLAWQICERKSKKVHQSYPCISQGNQDLSVLTEPTILYSLIRLASSKGKYPAIRTNKIMPQDHTSAAIPS